MMSARMGRPLKTEYPRTKKLTIRLSDHELERIGKCADVLSKTRTDTIMLGIDLLEKDIKNRSSSAVWRQRTTPSHNPRKENLKHNKTALIDLVMKPGDKSVLFLVILAYGLLVRHYC